MTCRFCKNPLIDGAKVCAECGRHQKWGTLQSANALVALLVALLSVGTLAWDRISPVVFPARAAVMIELDDRPQDGALRFHMTNLSSILASVPRFAWCRPVPPARFVQRLGYITSEGFVVLSLAPEARRSLVLEDIDFVMPLMDDLFPAADVAAGLHGAFDCSITPEDGVGPLESFHFRLYFQYVRGIRLVSASAGRATGSDIPIDPMLFFARAEHFGCGSINLDPGQPACD